MASSRVHPADLMKYHHDRITDLREQLEEILAAISEHADALKRVANDTQRRLLTRQ